MTESQPLPTDQPDPELMALAGAGHRPSILRPILMVAVIVMAGWIISDWRSELEYFFSDSEPAAMGDATEIAIKRAENPDYVPDLPHNRYVELRGIPTQRSQSARYRFFSLVGSNIYVEQPRDDYIEDPLERELKGDAKGDVDRTLYRGAGRILKFSEIPQRYHGLRSYYQVRYGVEFCDMLSAADREEIVRQRRDSVLQQWRLEYKDATAEERQEQKMTLEPTPEELERVIHSEPICIDAYLVQDGVTPKDHWWYVAVAGIFLIFMVVNVVLLGKWVVQFARA